MKDRTVRALRWMATEGAAFVGTQVFLFTSGALQVWTSLPVQITLGAAGGAGLAAYAALRFYRRGMARSLCS